MKRIVSVAVTMVMAVAAFAVISAENQAEAGLFGNRKKNKCCEPVCCEPDPCCCDSGRKGLFGRRKKKDCCEPHVLPATDLLPGNRPAARNLSHAVPSPRRAVVPKLRPVVALKLRPVDVQLRATADVQQRATADVPRRYRLAVAPAPRSRVAAIAAALPIEAAPAPTEAAPEAPEAPADATT